MSSIKIFKTLFAVSIIFIGSLANAKEFNPAIVYAEGSKADGSFNQSAYDGAERFKKRTGINYTDFEPVNPRQQEGAVHRLVKLNMSPVVLVGFTYAPLAEKIAPLYKETNFVLIDSKISKQDNAASITFRDNEGSFLVGAIAAMKSKTGVVSFVGGMDISNIHSFQCGFYRGARHINPNVKVIVNYIGSTPDAWTNVPKAKEITLSQISQGSDVVFAAAGQASIGTHQAAKEKGTYAIGVDSNQNHTFPGTMLTSMVKEVGVAVEMVFDQSREGKFEYGKHYDLGLKGGYLNWAYDEHNKNLFTAAEVAKINQLQQDIIDGKVKIDPSVDVTNGKCGS